MDWGYFMNNYFKKPRKKTLLFALLLLVVSTVTVIAGLFNSKKSGNPVARRDNSDELQEQDKNSSNTQLDNTQATNDSVTQVLTKTPVDIHGQLHVEQKTLKDESGNAVILRGISSHGLSWYPQYINKDAFLQMRDEWGVDIIRLAMYTAEEQGYCVSDDTNRNRLENVIEQGVSYATELGMYVIIDWHIMSDYNPNTNKAEAIKFFDKMSSKYSKNKNVLYEICNEPNGDTTWSDIKEYANDLIPVIRVNNPDAIILVGTPTWSQDVDIAAKDPLDDYNNIMYTLHFYAATHKENLRKKLTSALNANLPVFVSEFGICDASGNGNIDKSQADQWISFLEKNQISYIAWNLSNKPESSALIQPNCNKTSGWTDDDLTDSAHWMLNTLKKSK
jgi:endoglucanase